MYSDLTQYKFFGIFSIMIQSRAASIGGEVQIITNFAFTHFSAAKHFSDKCCEIEASNSDQPFGNFFEEISIYCAGTVISAAASLEALINELFIAPGKLHDAIGDFDETFWGSGRGRGIERKSALEKYKKAVNILEKRSLSRSDTPYRNAETLIGYRNYLIHFKPLWDSRQRDEMLEDRLSGLFKTSPFVDEGADFLGKKCITCSCAQWAVQTTTDFISYFAKRSELGSKKLGVFR